MCHCERAQCLRFNKRPERICGSGNTFMLTAVAISRSCVRTKQSVSHEHKTRHIGVGDVATQSKITHVTNPAKHVPGVRRPSLQTLCASYRFRKPAQVAIAPWPCRRLQKGMLTARKRQTVKSLADVLLGNMKNC